MPMTSRQLVEAAINHREPYRVPLDMWVTDSRLVDDFYFKVLDHLGWEERGEIERPGKTAAYVDYRLSDLLGCDFRHITAKGPDGFNRWTDDEGNAYDEWGIGYKKMGAPHRLRKESGVVGDGEKIVTGHVARKDMSVSDVLY